MRDQVYRWQSEAFAAWVEHGHRGVVEAVTGAGKTRLGVLAVKAALSAGINVVIMVPTIELLDQWMATLRAALPQQRIGRLGGGGHDDLYGHDLIVGTVHSVARAFMSEGIELLSSSRQGLLVADECHRYAADQCSAALSENFDWRLGLTATYERTDELDKSVLDPFFGGVVFRLWYDRALDDGVIAPFDVALVGVLLDPARRATYDDYSHRIRESRRGLQWNLPQRMLTADGDLAVPFPVFLRMVTIWAAADDGSARSRLAATLLNLIGARRRLLADAPAKILALDDLLPAIRAAHGALVFAQTQDAANAATDRLRSAGVEAAATHSGLTREDRHLRLDRFRSREIDVLAAPRVLDEGVDVPDADLGLIIAANHSRRQMVQRLGRIIRRKTPPRAGRLVYLYAIDTVEDPNVAGDEHLSSILRYARRVGWFDSSRDPELLRFLLAEQAVPAREPEQVPEPEFVGLNLPDDSGQGPENRRPGIHVCADALHDHLLRIGRYELLTAEQERALGRCQTQGELAQEALQQERYATRRQRRVFERQGAAGASCTRTVHPVESASGREHRQTLCLAGQSRCRRSRSGAGGHHRTHPGGAEIR